jgi:SAM-dependent methyltransferase
MSDIPREFTDKYYDEDYYKTPQGKKFLRPDGSIEGWSYANPTGESQWFKRVTEVWKQIFQPQTMLDVGCGRGTVVAYARDAGIEAYGFDFSEWAISDEGRYPRCKKEWLKQHDVTKPWPYPDDSLNLVTALDLCEHIYIDDIPFMIKELYRVANKWIFLQIATVGGGCDLIRPQEEGYILKKGEPVPIELEGNAVAGHVTVQPESFWLEKLEHDDWINRPDQVNHFTALMGHYMNKNWLLNTMICLEKI